SKILTPHPKPKPHLLSEGCKPLHGDKQEINPFPRKIDVGNEWRTPHFIFHDDFSRAGLFPVYRLVLDAQPDRVMLCLAENH
ncbi:MAG: hypothetical protein MR641_03395, partial [Bacteroidales bacterium]|nr:hypothetical protein [Bacteroidales bacterium]